MTAPKLRRPRAYMAGTLAGLMVFCSTGCKTVRPFVGGSVSESGETCARAGIVVGAETKQESFYQRHKKGIWITAGVVVVGGLVAILSGGGDSGGDSEPAPTTQVPTPTNNNNDDRDEAPQPSLNDEVPQESSGGSGGDSGGGDWSWGDL